mmetsp:Transcript_28435/g.80245  ORF Transcript_28435/g.80245 Transcript_28435/m.80245 type:complete len:81 (+) Transcript_28435:443-685(+)
MEVASPDMSFLYFPANPTIPSLSQPCQLIQLPHTMVDPHSVLLTPVDQPDTNHHPPGIRQPHLIDPIVHHIPFPLSHPRP